MAKSPSSARPNPGCPAPFSATDSIARYDRRCNWRRIASNYRPFGCSRVRVQEGLTIARLSPRNSSGSSQLQTRGCHTSDNRLGLLHRIHLLRHHKKQFGRNALRSNSAGMLSPKAIIRRRISTTRAASDMSIINENTIMYLTSRRDAAAPKQFRLCCS